MHISCDDIPILSDLFREKYQRELIGTNMGQFHTDFDHRSAVNDDIYARNTIILGKKMYIDELVGLDKDGNEVIDHHIRFKGISNDSIMFQCEKDNCDPLELYERLYKGEAVLVDLLCGGSKPCFKFNSNYTIKASSKFERTMRCLYEEAETNEFIQH